MGKNLFDLRFVVERADGLRSLPWRLWVTSSGDVYLTTRRMGGIQKFSFHVSGVCRGAFTKEHGAPANMPDRAMFKWRRAQTPTAGQGGASRVAWIAYPSDYLSRTASPVAKTERFAAAPAGGATYVEIAYTLESEAFVHQAFKANSRCLHSFTRLPNGEAVFVSWYHGDWENNDVKSHPAPDSVFPELLFSATNQQNEGRPIRMLFGPLPKDGDALVLQELGGMPAAE
jgi:hypothetical protein